MRYTYILRSKNSRQLVKRQLWMMISFKERVYMLDALQWPHQWSSNTKVTSDGTNSVAPKIKVIHVAPREELCARAASSLRKIHGNELMILFTSSSRKYVIAELCARLPR